MKHIGLLALLLGTSVMVSAAVVPEGGPTPVKVADTAPKEIIIDVPESSGFSEELTDPMFNDLRKMQGITEGKYARNAIKMMRDNPEGFAKYALGVDAKDLDISATQNKPALGTNRAPRGFDIKDDHADDENWMDVLADVQLPEFQGDYEDLNVMRDEMLIHREKGIETIKNLDFRQIMQGAPIRQPL